MQLFGSSKLTAQTAVIALIAGLLGVGVVLGVASPAEANGAPQCSTSASTNSLYSGAAGQDGSSFDKAYRIATSADLIRISQTTADWNNKFFLQTADIDLGGCYWDPIGITSASDFEGLYDGGGFKIQGLNVNDTSGASSPSSVGLFGYIRASTIRNLTVAGTISSNSTYVGGLAGAVEASTLTSLRSEVNVDFDNINSAGGIVGNFSGGGSLTYSSYSGTLRSKQSGTNNGGLVGNSSISLSDSYITMIAESTPRTDYSPFKNALTGFTLSPATIVNSFAVAPATINGISRVAPDSVSNTFWSTSDGGPAFALESNGSIAGATGKITSELQTFSTFSDAGWDIVNGWDTFDPSTSKVWGICSGVNSGYPFLLWEYSSNPCAVPSSGSSGFSITLPSSAVAEISLSGSGLKKSSMLRVRLTKIPAAFEQLVLVVRLNDFQNALLEELRIPIAATATFVDVPIDRPVGQFNVFAQTSNAGSASAGVFLKPHTVKQSALRKAVQGKPARLLGSQLGDDILFGSGSASLTPKAKKNLRQAAKLAKASDSRVSVTGIAGAASNASKAEKRLAEKRALRVANYLSRQGLTNWIYYFGLSSGKSAEIKGQPQRVELRILR
jgi:hypothetical protein